ncbi:hypothetical protein niasHT_012431 [Heterodera trifolii]|uniref:Uncharacterized protein n=1 Tax=Heterodera trifolii TaxID=157864 RepID=A0ABD2L332_9BILA
MIHTGVHLETIEIFRLINSRIYEVQQMIVDCVSNQCADQPENCQEMVKVAKAQLSVRLLITMAKCFVENRILYQIYNNPLQKARLCKWWYRFRYSVAASAIKFVDSGTSSQIRLGILQYYLYTQSKLKALIVQFDKFHFGCPDGIFIGDKIRKRDDPAKGIKFHRIGYTKKSQWEVQKIFDRFNDFYMENERLKEGNYSSRKYDLRKNNCIDFSKEFVEALLEGDKQLKSKHWPPRVLRQPPINDKSCGFSSCFIPTNMPEDQQNN